VTDLADFLRARYGEIRAAAEAAHQADPAPWTADASEPGYTNVRGHAHGAGIISAADGEPLWDCEGSGTLCMTAPSARHAALHHPLNVIADIDAKLALVDAYVGAEKTLDAWTCPDDRIIGHADGLDDALRLLAQPFAGHADYKEEWRP
jgi:hypothetical protein